MTTSTQTPAIEASCDLRFGQVGLACVRVHKADAAALHEALEHRVRSAPHLFSRAAVVLDFSHLPSLPDTDMAGDLLEAIRNAGMLPAGLAYGDQETEALARRINLPLISGFRAVYESGTPHPTTINTPASVQGTLHHDDTVRSGQRIYAHDRALVVTGQVANGAEVIADGDIHVYGKLRGRALAGAQGNHSARIFVSDFRAELIAIAGHYRVFEQIPDELERQFVRCRLENDTLWVTRL